MDWKKALRGRLDEGWRFIRFVITHFIEDDCPYRASALAFTTLLAIVPLMTVGLAILSSLPVFQGFREPLQNFIFENFVPATGKVVQNYIVQFATQASRLSVIGVVFLFVTAILLMVTIERAMNKIWHVNESRHGIAAFLLYWSILSLAPLFLGLSLTASSYLFSLLLLQHYQAPSFFLQILPFFFSLSGFTFLYVVVPNQPIKVRDGLAGGLVATLLFESAKHSFAYYLGHYNTYELLYGAFASVPIFFIWIYWVWIITLLGAEICYALSVSHQRRIGTPVKGFLHALLWLHELWYAQKTSGQGLNAVDLTNSSSLPYEVDVADMLNELENHNLIHPGLDNLYYLSRDLSEISLFWLSQHLPYPLPANDEMSACPSGWQDIFVRSNTSLQKSLGLTITTLFERP